MKPLHAFTLAALAWAVAGCSTPQQPAPGPVHDELVAASRKTWTPGGAAMMPQAVLDEFPCHDDEQPCSQLPPPPIQKVSFKAPLRGDARKGEAIATNIRYGNCIACHSLPNGHEGGSIGPSLRDYAQRSMPLDYTFQRIWDVRVFNPNAFMPIYGPNRVLTEQEIHDVMAFLLGAKGG